MGKKPEPPKPDVLAAIAEQTGTNKQDWTFLGKSSRMYAKGFRYYNRATNQYAKRNVQ